MVNIPNKQIVRILDTLLDGYEPATELLPLEQCPGRVLAGDVAAGDDVPGFDRASAEGFALLAKDTAGATPAAPATLTLLDDDASELGGGQCAHVLPGAPIPKGADCVAGMNVSLMLGTDSQHVFIEQPQQAGMGIISQRKDIRRGQIMLKKGTVLAGRHIALLAALGISQAPVLAMPDVFVLSYGRRLVDVNEDTDGHLLRDMVSPMLEAELLSINALPHGFGVVDDKGLVQALGNDEADICIVSGDGLNRTIEGLPDIVEVGYLEIQGATMGMFSREGRLIILLPGHPVQAYFFFKLLCQPILQGMCGTDSLFSTVQARLDSLPAFSEGYSYIPVSINESDSIYTAHPLDIVNCPISGLLQLHGYACIEPASQPGQLVNVIIF